MTHSQDSSRASQEMEPIHPLQVSTDQEVTVATQLPTPHRPTIFAQLSGMEFNALELGVDPATLHTELGDVKHSLPGDVYPGEMTERQREVHEDLSEINPVIAAQWALDCLEASSEAKLDADPKHADPRWTGNREPRFTTTDPSKALDDLATALTGIPSEPEKELVTQITDWVEDPEGELVAVPVLAVNEDELPAASEVTTRTARVYRMLLDRANAQLVVQRHHNFGVGSVSSWKTVWRAGYTSLAEARAATEAYRKAVVARGDVAHIAEMPGRERILVIVRGHTVTVRPDNKAAKVTAKKHYPTTPEAKAAYHRILAHFKARNVEARGWVAA